MNRHCSYWTFNDKQLQSVVSKFLDIIVFAIVCIIVVVSICERLCVVLLVTLLRTMYWYMHWCVEFENENAFQMYKRLFYCTHGWRRGSVVRMSVCSRRTFPDLRLIHG